MAYGPRGDLHWFGNLPHEDQVALMAYERAAYEDQKPKGMHSAGALPEVVRKQLAKREAKLKARGG